MDQRRLDAFSVGAGVEAPKFCCAECGYESEKRRNFVKGEGDTRVCSTGHFLTGAGETRRQRNGYAKVVR